VSTEKPYGSNKPKMETDTPLHRILHFFLTKIIIGLAVVVGSVVFMEWSGSALLENTNLAAESKNLVISICVSGVAVFTYVLLFRAYEKRRIRELSLSGFVNNAILGVATGLTLQSLFILVIFISGGYTVTYINSLSVLIPSLDTALTAGVVAELLIRGVFFRITEEKFGTSITVLVTPLIFALLHSGKGATFLSVCSTAMQAGIVISAAYVYSRSLWLPIGIHFAWDFAEPGIFGSINPGTSLEQSLLTSTITGPAVLTGGSLGAQNSIQALLFCSVAAILFLWLAKRRGSMIKPYWKR
jgi:uncharacterized protein